MPSGTPQDADNKFYTKITGSFQPNGTSQPVVSTISGPPGIVFSRGAPGIFNITLPATYTASIVQSFYMVFGHIKNAATDPVIYGGMVGGFSVPSIQFTTTTSAGAPFDFGPLGGERFVWELYIKYTTVLTF